jgi:hypothetical protein
VKLPYYYDEVDIEANEGQRLASPGRCIYCSVTCEELTDEHVIPYALGKNALVLLKSCCTSCQKAIQPYEQHVLRRQLGNFRAQVGAPTRRKKDRPTEINYDFVEVDDKDKILRGLGSRKVDTENAPLCLNLWASPPPRIALPNAAKVGSGRLWTCSEREILNLMCREVGEANGAKRVAVFLGDIDRTKYLRSLAKTAHAFTCAKLGIDGFNPLLHDIILCRNDDVSYYVGDMDERDVPEISNDHSLRIFLGVPEEGPIAGYIVVSVQLYPELGSPVHIIVVGTPNGVTTRRLDAIREASEV